MMPQPGGLAATPGAYARAPMPRLLASAATGYLVGSVPTAAAVTRVATGGRTDLRSVGSGNPGAANAIAVLGPRWGTAVLGADIAKGALACAAGRWLGGGEASHLAGTAAVVGHCLPVWSGFRGGKGVAASCGQCLATFPVYLPFDLALAWAVGRWKGRALPATAVASAAWVAAGLLWWRRGWPNAWGPRPSAALPAAAAASSAVILSRFVAAARARPEAAR